MLPIVMRRFTRFPGLSAVLARAVLLLAAFGLAAPVAAQWLRPDQVVISTESYGAIHPYRAALEAAYSTETDPGRLAVLRNNLDRWRDLPAALGRRHVMVNIVAQEVVLWEDNAVVGRWPVIVGRRQTPTEIFSTEITGVNLNPWWYIPQSIVRESIGALVRNSPAEARRRGYVVSNGSYRQRPGPNNALGRMKLVMPNDHAIYLHDTPSQHLFGEDRRTFSHGCIRVEDALGFAATLLGTTRAAIEAQVASGETRTLSLAEPLPVHIVYFTAVPQADGSIRYFDDFYGRDATAD